MIAVAFVVIVDGSVSMCVGIAVTCCWHCCYGCWVCCDCWEHGYLLAGAGVGRNYF